MPLILTETPLRGDKTQKMTPRSEKIKYGHHEPYFEFSGFSKKCTKTHKS